MTEVAGRRRRARRPLKLCGGGRLYIPPASAGGGSLQRAHAALREAIADETTTPEPLPDAGFELLRRLEASAALGDDPGAAAARRRRRRGGVAVRAPRRAAGDGPASGDILLSHPLMRRDVALLAADGADGFAFGLADERADGGAARRQRAPRRRSGGARRRRRRRSSGRRAAESSRVSSPVAAARRTRDDELRVFANSVVFYGGPDGTANLTMLHPHGQLRGCAPVRDGLFYGGELGHAAPRRARRRGAAVGVLLLPRPRRLAAGPAARRARPRRVGPRRGRQRRRAVAARRRAAARGEPRGERRQRRRSRRAAASAAPPCGTVDPLDPADGGGGGGGGGSAAQQRALQRYRIAAWSHVAHALGCASGFRMRQVLARRALRARGAPAGGSGRRAGVEGRARTGR